MASGPARDSADVELELAGELAERLAWTARKRVGRW